MYYKIVPPSFLKSDNVVEENGKRFFIKRSQSEKMIGKKEFLATIEKKKQYTGYNPISHRQTYRKVEPSGIILLLDPIKITELTDNKIYLKLFQKVEEKVQIFEICRVMTMKEAKEYSMLG